MICDSDKRNFEQLKEAATCGRLALMECMSVKDKQIVSVVCAVNEDDGDVEFVPLAILTTNPYEELAPPSPDDPQGFIMPDGSNFKLVAAIKQEATDA